LFWVFVPAVFDFYILIRTYWDGGWVLTSFKVAVVIQDSIRNAASGKGIFDVYAWVSE
jgi:hypothetical protein